jgi:hypothetical protein
MQKISSPTSRRECFKCLAKPLVLRKCVLKLRGNLSFIDGLERHLPTGSFHFDRLLKKITNDR